MWGELRGGSPPPQQIRHRQASIVHLDSPVHLVLLNQYYPPDEAPTGLMLEAVARQLAAQGHEVTVLASEGGYAGGGAPAEIGGSTAAPAGLRVLRIGATKFGRGSVVAKLVDYASFYLGVTWRLLTLSPRPERIVALTTPPYLSVLARLASRLRGADHAHWVMDLYPDVMVAHGMMRDASLPHRLLAGLTRLGFGGDRCSAVVTLGPDMEERVARYLEDRARVHAVPLWATGAMADGGWPMEDGGSQVAGASRSRPCPEHLAPVFEQMDEQAESLRRDRGWADDELVLMYSGNMGLGHRFSEMLKSGNAEMLKGRMVFFGGGKRRGEIERFMADHPEAPVELHDYVARGQLSAHLRSADVHLASLEPSWDGCMVPSKLQGIFAAGRPVIFVGSGESSIGRWIRESGGGWVVAPNDLNALQAAIAEASDPAERDRRGEAAAAFAREHFDPGRNAQAVAELLAKRGLGL